MFRAFIAASLLATPSPQPVLTWINENAVPRVTREMIGSARVVGLGESTHGTHDESVIKFRTIRMLVEDMGFRSIAWEEDWTMGIKINEYLLTGRGDLDSLIREMTTTWHMREVRDVLTWLRTYNAEHADKVRFVGVEYYATRSLAYDAVDAYVKKAAPAKLDELREHLDFIRPRHEDPGKNLDWYRFEVPDKEPFIAHARAVYDLVDGLPHTKGQRLALQHARQILSWYDGHSRAGDANFAYRDARAAENLRWWQRRTKDKVAYWAAAAHTANAPRLQAVLGGFEVRFASAGSYLKRWYGGAYRSVGVSFDHGTLIPEAKCAGTPAEVPRPDPRFVNRTLGDAGPDEYALDLHAKAPKAVRKWLRAPMALRGYAGYDPARPQGSYFTGGSLAEWFDVVVHRKVISSCRPL